MGLLKRPVATGTAGGSSINIGDGGRFVIWAEENSALSTSIENGYQWSFGNGAVGAGNEVSLPFNCELVGLTLDKRAAAGSAEVAVLKNGTQIASISVETGDLNALTTLEDPVEYEAGDRLQFRTISASGFASSNTCIMGAAFKTTGLANTQTVNNTMINGALEYYFIRNTEQTKTWPILADNPEGLFVDLRSNLVEINESDNIRRDRNELILKPGKKYLVKLGWTNAFSNVHGLQFVKVDSDANFIEAHDFHILHVGYPSSRVLIDTTDETQDTIWFLAGYTDGLFGLNATFQTNLFIQVYNDNTSGTALANQASLTQEQLDLLNFLSAIEVNDQRLDNLNKLATTGNYQFDAARQSLLDQVKSINFGINNPEITYVADNTQHTLNLHFLRLQLQKYRYMQPDVIDADPNAGNGNYELFQRDSNGNLREVELPLFNTLNLTKGELHATTKETDGRMRINRAGTYRIRAKIHFRVVRSTAGTSDIRIALRCILKILRLQTGSTTNRFTFNTQEAFDSGYIRGIGTAGHDHADASFSTVIELQQDDLVFFGAQRYTTQESATTFVYLSDEFFSTVEVERLHD